ncbi:TetR/AcrR family transcriptional regulator [Rhizobium sp. KVB221]|uniref:TetR/AcrR family transcriptional regulator n=1 Tax=Rhizobium setariae TaxID=2801340 RepID=A0A936YND2_9HYPH|nr:TetR/AcrR family transcriptional regulator [Rhizobium setariae]MBL0371456.1 TetR/AcrR family transcriptional regulator [Rhizobium setariae]
MTKQPGKSAAKRGRILDAAFEIFAARGFSGASMDEIAKLAEVSKPTLYTYFGDKEGLFTALLDLQKADLLIPFERTEGHDMVETMLDFGMKYAVFALDPKVIAFGRMVISEAGRFPGIGRLYLEAGPDRALNGIVRYMDAMRERGRLAFDDHELAADDFWSLILSTPRGKAHLRPELTFEELQPERHVINGIRVFLKAYSTNAEADLALLGRLSEDQSRIKFIGREHERTGKPAGG